MPKRRCARQANWCSTGFALRTDAKIVRHPDRYMDPRGADLWERVTGMLADLRAVPEETF